MKFLNAQIGLVTLDFHEYDSHQLFGVYVGYNLTFGKNRLWSETGFVGSRSLN